MPEEILSGRQNPYVVHLSVSGKDIKLKLCTGEDEWLARRRFNREKSELNIPEGEGGWLELEQIVHCIVSWPFADKPKPTKFEDLLFLTQPDIQILKLAHMAANAIDAETFAYIDNLAKQRRADALWDALFLARELNMPFERAMKLSLPERVLTCKAVQSFLALTQEDLSQSQEKIEETD